MEDIIQVKDQFYVRAASSPLNERPHVLKQGNTFALFERLGNIRPLGIENHGLYCDGTRFLSRFMLSINGQYPLLLSSAVRENNDVLTVDATNPAFETADGVRVPQDTIHVLRTIFLWNNTLYETIDVHNYGSDPVQVPLTFHYEADFVDIFEVRGVHRTEHGTQAPVVAQGAQVVLAYDGLDNIHRETHLDFSPQPVLLNQNQAHFQIDLDPQQHTSLTLTVACQQAEHSPKILAHHDAIQQEKSRLARLREGICTVETSNEQFNAWLDASVNDLQMLLSETPHGVYPYAGVPWFSTVFGRDGIITALETLWMQPTIARGVLEYLAAFQATAVDVQRDAEPGKILHEQRSGEMANTGEVPFDNYYGSIDSTPLFIILAGRYFERTGDREFLARLWPAIEAGLAWIDTYGDADGDGFVEYERKIDTGLRNQGWKDSDDAVFTSDGTLARLPIALCEVQAYVYEAKLVAGRIAAELARPEQSEQLRTQAEQLRSQFLCQFWCAEIGMYALALDGDKQPCRVRSSNAGHCLFSGIADETHARRIVQHLISDSFFTGWGVRTIATSEVRYNPMSYHNGSIWPHDNAMIAYGLGRYGYKAEAAKILDATFEASGYLDLMRLPELFCGFERRSNEGPTLYPVACLPQAWAAGSVFLLLQACFGLTIDGVGQKVSFENPVLPESLQHVTLRGLRVGTSVVDIALYRHAQDVSINVMRREGDVEIVVKK